MLGGTATCASARRRVVRTASTSYNNVPDTHLDRVSDASFIRRASRAIANEVVSSPDRIRGTPSESSDHSRPRFRIAVHPADRAPSARVVGLLRDSSVRYAARGHQAARARSGIVLSGGPKSVSDTRSAALRTGRLRRRRAGARNLLRHAAHDARARRRSRAGAAPRVRARDHRRASRARRSSRRFRRTCGCGQATATSSRPRRRAFRSPRPAPTRRLRRWWREERRLYALLFHPEVAHTDHGLDILRNFAYDVCGCTGDWTMSSFVQEATETHPPPGRATGASSADSAAASIPPWRRCSSTARSAIA